MSEVQEEKNKEVSTTEKDASPGLCCDKARDDNGLEPKPALCSGHVKLLGASLVVLVLAVGLYGATRNQGVLVSPAATVDIVKLQQRIEVVEKRMDAVQSSDKHDTIEHDAVAIGQAAGVTPDDVEKQDVEALKSSVAALTASLETMQSQMMKSTEVLSEMTVESVVAMRVEIARVFAFMELQRRELSGQTFEKERQAMVEIVRNDQPITERLASIEEQALSGVPSVPALRTAWRALTPQAQTALLEAGAQTWLDRLVVALQGLISIRSLNPQDGEMLTFTAIDIDLEKGDTSAALEKVQALPASVQAVIKDWKAKLEARHNLDAAMDDIAARLIATGKVFAVEQIPPEQPPPPMLPQAETAVSPPVAPPPAPMGKK